LNRVDELTLFTFSDHMILFFFKKRTAIACHPDSRKSDKFWQYAVVVLFKKGFDIASMIRVPVAVRQSHDIDFYDSSAHQYYMIL